ncbi:hypothetical protein [Bartonella sp. CB189]|uniref:hypothetical protein n=1 Tax=Bartonella sp. CB189 TaxID=3112254 RepID=UPI002F963A45
MTIPNFVTRMTAYISAINATMFSFVCQTLKVGYALKGNGNYDLLRYLSVSEKVKIIVHQPKYNKYDRHIGLREADIETLKRLIDLPNLCKRLKIIQISLTHCRKGVTLQYRFKDITRQPVLSFYNINDFKHGFLSSCVKKVTSYVRVQAFVFISLNDKLQKLIQFQIKKQEEMV